MDNQLGSAAGTRFLLIAVVLSIPACLSPKTYARYEAQERQEQVRVRQKMSVPDGYDLLDGNLADSAGDHPLEPDRAPRKLKFCVTPDARTNFMTPVETEGKDAPELRQAVSSLIERGALSRDRYYFSLSAKMLFGSGGHEIIGSIPMQDKAQFQQSLRWPTTTRPIRPGFCVWLADWMVEVGQLGTRSIYHIPVTKWRDSEWLASGDTPAGAPPTVSPNPPLQPPAPPTTSGGCSSDMDCKGERVCENRQCITPRAPSPVNTDAMQTDGGSQ